LTGDEDGWSVKSVAATDVVDPHLPADGSITQRCCALLRL